MNAWTNPRDPDVNGSGGAPGTSCRSDGGGGRRGSATAAVGATVIAMALGATACAGTPAGNSSQASLAAQASLSSQQAAAMPSAVLAMTPTTASKTLRQSAAASPGTGHAKSHAPSTAPAPSGPALSHASAAPSAPSTWTAPAAPSTGSTPSTAPATGSTPSEPATGGSSTGTLSLTTGCAAVTTVQVLSSFSCPVTVSGGTPGYGWTLFVNGEDAALVGTLPLGIETTGTDTTYIIGGKPEQWGTFTFAVTVMDNTPTSPPHTASTSFTVIVPEPPA